MFPYVRRALRDFLSSSWESPAVQSAVAQLAADNRDVSLTDPVADTDPVAALWPQGAEIGQQIESVERHVHDQMDRDAKTTGLKELQGLIWRSGFEHGELTAHVYPDVLPALQTWQDRNMDIRIYSSGSVLAQKLFFGHTIAGDLLSYFHAHYDTTIGGKKEVLSYQRIVAEFAVPAGEILFVSDIPSELDAAHTAGLQTAWSIRPENPPLPACKHASIRSFEELL